MPASPCPARCSTCKIDDFRRQLAVNLTGQLIVTQAFAPLLGADRVAAGQARPHRHDLLGRRQERAPCPAPTPPRSSALEGLSESLRRELMLFGIDVVVVAPGAVATPIWDKAEEIDITPFETTPYAAPIKTMRGFMIALGRKGLPPEKIGEVVRAALTIAKPKVRYTVAPNPMQHSSHPSCPSACAWTLYR